MLRKVCPIVSSNCLILTYVLADELEGVHLLHILTSEQQPH